MLTPRGFWFFVVIFTLFLAALLIGSNPMALLSGTLLAWFLLQWFTFQLRARLAWRRFRLQRSLRTSRGEVDAVWAQQRIDVSATLYNDSSLGLTYAVVTDRMPALGRFVEGTTSAEGELSRAKPLRVEYSVRCLAAGRLRFEGVKVQLADLQGFFTLVLFVRDLREIRVLPSLATKSGLVSFVKRYNVLPLLGRHRHARPGGSSELLDLRDYLPGDPPKLIAWKLSARRDRLITKELESEVPIRCTLFVDVSSAVRVGPVGETALCRLVDVAAEVAQTNAAERDLTGLCLFDDQRVRTQIKPGRGSKHVVKMIGQLADVAGLIPYLPNAKVRELLPAAHALAQELYPHFLDPDANSFPAWLPLWSPQPRWTMPPGVTRPWRFLLAYHREYRWRKTLAAILAVRYDLGPGGLAVLLEDDEQCAHYLQRFLAEHHVSVPFSLYDETGRSRFHSVTKPKVLADALLKAIAHGKDNELFVLCADLLDNLDELAPLERAVAAAKARHHQVVVVCAWPASVDAPGRTSKYESPSSKFDLRVMLQRICAAQLHEAFGRLRKAMSRIGVSVLCAADPKSVSGIMVRMHRLRIQQRGVR